MSKTHETNTDTITVKQVSSPSNESAGGAGGIIQNLTSLVPMVLIFVVFYFLVMRPQEKKKRQHAAMLDTVKKGEEVLLHSGIYGFVSKVSDTFLEVEVSDGVVVKVVKHAVADIISRKEKGVTAKEPKDDKKEEKSPKKNTKKIKT